MNENGVPLKPLESKVIIGDNVKFDEVPLYLAIQGKPIAVPGIEAGDVQSAQMLVSTVERPSRIVGGNPQSVVVVSFALVLTPEGMEKFKKFHAGRNV